jgi:hypothetical protein
MSVVAALMVVPYAGLTDASAIMNGYIYMAPQDFSFQFEFLNSRS